MSHYQNFTPPFPIPDSWQWVKLEDIITIRSGENIVVRNLKDSDIFPVYGGNGINGYYEKANVEVDTLIIGRVGFYCGSIHRTKSKAWITDNALIVTTFANHLNIDWLQMALMWANIRDTSNSTAQPVVSGKSIYPIVVPLPPLEEQVQIANKFKSFEVCISQLSQEIDDLIDYVNTTKSKILELAMQGKLVPQDPTDEPAADMLRRVNPKARIITDNPHYPQLPSNWVYVRLSDIATLLSGRDIEGTSCNSASEGIPYLIGASNITDGSFSFNRWTTQPQVISKKDDILISCKGTIGELLKNTRGDIHIARQFMAIRSHRTIRPNFLQYALLNNLASIRKKANGIIPGISRPVILDLVIPLPPIIEHDRIVSRILEFESLLESIEYVLN